MKINANDKKMLIDALNYMIEKEYWNQFVDVDINMYENSDFIDFLAIEIASTYTYHSGSSLWWCINGLKFISCGKIK